MHRKKTLSIALALSVALVSLMSSDSTAKAQPGGRKFRADTGIVTLGPNQILRVTVAAGDVNGDNVRVRFQRMEYVQGSCGGGICRLAAASQTTSDPITLMPGEAASIDIPNTAFGVRGLLVGLGNIGVTAMIINTSTGEVTSQIIIANTEGDIH
jgi:hypothetical protein